MKTDKRNVRIIFRVSNTEYNQLKELVPAHGSMSKYIRDALSEYSNVDAKSRLELMDKLLSFYEKYHSMLYHTTANLNQSVKHINELAAAGLLRPHDISALMPHIDNTHDIISAVHSLLLDISHTATKL